MSEILWGTWTCTKCRKDNSGKLRACSKCGDERDFEELAAIRLDENAPVVTDENELRQARLGPDWTCVACNVTVQGDQLKCPTCGAKQGATTEDLMFRAKTRAGDPLERALLIEQDGDVEGRLALEGRGTRPWYEGALGRGRDQIVRNPRTSIGILCGILAVVLIGFFWWGLSIHTVDGKVTGMNWTQRTERLTWTPTQMSDWEASLSNRPETKPVNGRGEVAGIRITNCAPKHHHDERYACGSHQESRSERVACGSHQSCSNSSNGNGSFSRSCSTVTDYCNRSYTVTVTDYCSRPIYRSYCSYDTQMWMQTEILSASGIGVETRWPEMTPRVLDKIVHRGDWTVLIQYTDDGEVETTENHPTSEAEYKTWSVGEKTHVDVRGWGSVSGVRRWSEIPVN
jgi:hypothetical protein